VTPEQAHRRDTYRLGYQHGRRIAQHQTDTEDNLKLEVRLAGTTNQEHRAFALGELRGYRQAQP
jgi:hypothetical protein